jgi:hypothetical protein
LPKNYKANGDCKAKAAEYEEHADLCGFLFNRFPGNQGILYVLSHSEDSLWWLSENDMAWVSMPLLMQC